MVDADPEVTRAVWRHTSERRLGIPLGLLACPHMIHAELNIWVEAVNTKLCFNDNLPSFSHLHADEVWTLDWQVTQMLFKQGQVMLAILSLKIETDSAAVILLWSRKSQIGTN